MPGELVDRLQRVRAQVDDNAVHYVGGGKASRADARNSVFKLKYRFATMPERNRIRIMMDMFGHVLGEHDPSDDEDWGNWNKDKVNVCKSVEKLEQSADMGAVLVLEFEKVTQEDQEMEENLIDTEHATEKNKQTESVDNANVSKAILQTKHKTAKEVPEDVLELPSQEELTNNDEGELRKFNTLQREFMLQNLTEWYREIVKQYKEGVKLVKVARSGKKFIRVVKLTDSGFFEISSVTSKTDRKVHLTSIKEVDLGIEAFEFKQCAKINPQNPPIPELSCVLNLPDKKTLCLMFTAEEARNSFVFMIRVLKKKFENAKTA
ncbi:uncharacterized protein CMU_010950 [Cryptosporidium muris RN66]|uniref:Uncharacterized protein n=1 Tax=Cryptosporidium muris (strain RN66) TaxID=441375 RepID=B6AIV6_CRYMR|nr:uncharacterized protein CMU_010950 [Cryptosporidium muris RN66]EEA08147.1 hypothetical protein, conserved [Cryptosporidium muris RN66]|eukprot:XP_002142496.1 hypothetical protein [Cryptosporidium muris RN66]